MCGRLDDVQHKQNKKTSKHRKLMRVRSRAFHQTYLRITKPCAGSLPNALHTTRKEEGRKEVVPNEE